MKDCIVVLTEKIDFTVDHLMSSMQKRHIPVMRFDTSSFPVDMMLDASFTGNQWQGHIKNAERAVDLQDIKSIWYRRPTHYRVSTDLPEPYTNFAEGEASQGFGGILRSLECFWVSQPDALRAANFKPLQIKLAKDLGFDVPRTLITNDPHAFRRFYYEECDRNVIVKTLCNGYIAMGGDEYHALYTKQVPVEMVQQYAENVRYTAHLFQECVPKEIELRITVIGTTVFTVGISSQHAEATRIDWRRNYADLHYCVYQLPQEIEQKCISLIKKLNLAYGTIDIIVQPTGQYTFLEINLGGQYMWLECESTVKLPMTDTLIDLLVEGKVDW